MNIFEFLNYAFVENYEILLVLIVTSISCALVGTFLLLRKLSMVSDAISHSVLLGIVLAYFITHDVTSPLLIIGACIFGVLTVLSIETISNTGLVKNDDAVGIFFPLFFSLAVILITKFARNVHLDIDIVLMGEVIMAPLKTIERFGLEIPKALSEMGIVLFLNTIFIIIFYKELKLTTFDPEYAKVVGFSSGLLFYILMTLSSLTTVVAFDAVGAILVVSFLITPAATSYLVTKNLKNMIIVAILFSIINSVIGFLLGMYYNLSISGMTATVSGVIFIFTFLFNKAGLLTLLITKSKIREEFKRDLFILHLGNHENNSDATEELGINSIKTHLMWSDKELKSRSEYLISKGLVKKDVNLFALTNKGRKKYKELLVSYGL